MGPKLSPIHLVLSSNHADLPEMHESPFLESLPCLLVAYEVKSKLLGIASGACCLAPQPCASCGSVPLGAASSYPQTSSTFLLPFYAIACAIFSTHSVLCILFGKFCSSCKARVKFLPCTLSHTTTETFHASHCPSPCSPSSAPLTWHSLSPPPRCVLVEGRHFV